jgi:hypothetical protein
MYVHWRTTFTFLIWVQAYLYQGKKRGQGVLTSVALLLLFVVSLLNLQLQASVFAFEVKCQ